MGPNLMLENMTVEPGTSASISEGTPESVEQLPRSVPGPDLSTGKVESSQSMLDACCFVLVMCEEEKGRGGEETHVVPETHDENHGASGGGTHLGEATLVVEGALIAEDLLLGVAVVLGDGVAGDAVDGGLGVGDDDVVLDVEAGDLGEAAVVALDELGDDGQGLCGVEGELGAGTVEGLVALAVAVEVAAVRVAVAAVTVLGVSAAAGITLAGVVVIVLARVRRVGGADAVGLPDVHLGAAGTEAADAGVGVVVGRLPVVRVGLSFSLLAADGGKDLLLLSSFLTSCKQGKGDERVWYGAESLPFRR